LVAVGVGTDVTNSPEFGCGVEVATRLEDEACSTGVDDIEEKDVVVEVIVGKSRLGPSGLFDRRNTTNAKHMPPIAISRIIHRMTFCERIIHETQ